jgi:poly-gamma-glutamate capsule biosynthesis protein CapA/YwtB (metallophosphatase superfamily)
MGVKMRNKIFIRTSLVIMLSILLCFVYIVYKDLKGIQEEKGVFVNLVKEESKNSSSKESTATDIKIPETDQEKNEEKIKAVKPLKFIAVGDILLGRAVKQRVIKKSERYLYPFLKVADILNSGDVVFGNLEESITDSTKSLTGIHQDGKYVLKNDVEAILGLKYAGFNLLSIANNHILDYYETGLFDTQKILSANNIAYAGAGKNLEEARKLTVIEKGGLKIGLLAYSDMAYVVYKGDPQLCFLAGKNNSGVAPTKEEYIKEDILKAKGSVDLLVVSFHWGIENSFDTTKKQIDFAHYLLDNGVDMILGHHPHRTQGVEIYKGKPIFYSLGNFIFDQNVPDNMQGFIMKMEFKEKKLSSLSALPYKILNKCQIVPQTGVSATAMFQRQIKLCEKLSTVCKADKDELVFDIKHK